MHPTEPYRHNHAQDHFDLTRLGHVLGHRSIGHTIAHYESVESTMPLAHHLAIEPATRSGTIVVADEQTAGRGRQARRWETPPRQALLTSLILKAPISFAPQELPMVAGLAIVDAVTSCWPALKGKVGLKWPNDLLLGATMMRARKFGGILIESSFYGANVNYFIVGMGINVLQDEAMLPSPVPGAPAPTSLRHYLTTEEAVTPRCDRTDLLIALCLSWAKLLASTEQFPSILDRWRSVLWTLGHQVTIYQGVGDTREQLTSGEAIDVTAEGHLLIRDAAGGTHSFAAGDVSVRFAEPCNDPTISRG